MVLLKRFFEAPIQIGICSVFLWISTKSNGCQSYGFWNINEIVVNSVSEKVELEIKVAFDMFCNLKKTLMINALSIFFFNLIN